jgi:serine protease Do
MDGYRKPNPIHKEDCRMKKFKFAAIILLMAAMLLSACASPSQSDTNDNTSGTSVVTTTQPLGDTTVTPETVGTLDMTGTPAAMSADSTNTPDSMSTQDTTGTPVVTEDTTSTPEVTDTTETASSTAAATMETTATPPASATLETTETPAASATLETTGTPEALATANPTITSPDVIAGSAGDLNTLQNTFEQIYNKVNPSVVYIEVAGNSASAANGSGSFRASGSGFIWDAQGHIVTNNHVVAGASSVNVTFADGNTVSAKVIGQDPNADLAVLEVTAPSTALNPVTVGDSTQVKVGQIVVAIGSPFALAGSMSEGIVSALARSLPVESTNQPTSNSTSGVYNIPAIIQTDASINPGNSGGVLVDIQGQVIGVTAAIASDANSSSGVGFVIPSEIVKKVVPDLISTGSFAHPWLGVTGRSLSPDIATLLNLPATQRGALIIGVTPGGPAEKAGLHPSTAKTVNGVQQLVGGDIVTAIDGKPIQLFEDLGSYLFLNTKPGDSVTLTILRDGKEQTVQVTLGTLPTP